ncbi:MAG TPA: hypothetical protein DCZ40_14240, partial [Lachnospiraceae bacterium]|nr:hypothetical protein [Lachnospiraceae bacterium]
MECKMRRNYYVMFLIVMLGLAGCSAKNGETEQREDKAVLESATEFPENMKEIINEVEFDLKVEVPENVDLNTIKKSIAVRQIPKADNIINIFAENKNVADEYRGEFEGENSVMYDTYYAKYDDESLISIDTTLVYSTPFFEKIHSAFHVEDGELYNADKYLLPTLNFQSPEVCFEEVKKLINQSGYELGECHYEYFSLDYNTMQQEESHVEMEGKNIESEKSIWTEEDDCYYFFAEQLHDGIPVYFGEQDFPQDSIENRPIQAVCSKDGLKRLDVAKVYTFETTDENIKLKQFDEIAQKVADKYGNILTGAKYTATRAKLYQMPVKTSAGKYEVKTVWLFEVFETGIDSETGEDFKNVLYTCID